jgi:hypothetical protein
MKIPKYWALTLPTVIAAVMLIGALRVGANQAPTGSTHIIVTVENPKSGPIELRSGDVMLYENKDRVPVTGITPLAGHPVELYVAIDDTLGTDFGTYLNDVRKFIRGQTANTAVGIAYMRNGTVEIRQKPTTDHAAAEKALRLPVASVGTSPFESIVALLKDWPPSDARHEIVMISNGVEPFGPAEVSNPFVDEAVSAAQRVGVPVFAIYQPAAGHWGHTFWRTTWAQTYMSRIGDQTGGEAYNITGITVTTLAPYFDDITGRLQRQYDVAFRPKPQSKAGFVPIRVTTELPHVDLVAQDRVWVEGGE